MSLINKMLRNIDKQHQHADGGYSSSVYDGLAPVAQRTSSWLSPILLIAILIGAGVTFGLHYNASKQPGERVSTASIQAVKVEKSGEDSSVSAAGVNPSAQHSATGLQFSRSLHVSSDPPWDGSRQETKAPTQTEPGMPARMPLTDPNPVALNETLGRDATKAVLPEKISPRAPEVATTSMKVVSPQQQSDNLYKQALVLLQQSQVMEAQQALKQAIGLNALNHGARQLLAETQADAGHIAEAENLLQEGLALAPGRVDLITPLARLQIANGNKDKALLTLQRGVDNAGEDPEYHAFLAAVLQDMGRHQEAIKHFIIALRSNPAMPSWLIGIGISLKAENKMNDAAEAFQRALDGGELKPEVARFAEQQLKQIRQQ